MQIADPVDSIDLAAIALLLKSNHLILDTRRSLLASLHLSSTVTMNYKEYSWILSFREEYV